MHSVPITFEFKGQVYTGTFETGTGTGAAPGDKWDLMIDRFYRGTLHYSTHQKDWRFDSTSSFFNELADYFQAYMVSWFQ